MVEHILFALSAAIVTVSTNLDNLVVLFGLIMVMETRRAVLGFAAAQTIILTVALIIASGLDQSRFLNWVGYLGLIPMSLGLYGIWQHWYAGDEGRPMPDTGAITSVVALFLSLSIDTLAAMTPLFADSTPAFRVTALFGGRVCIGRPDQLCSLGGSTCAGFGTALCPSGPDYPLHHGFRRAVYSDQQPDRRLVTLAAQ